MPDFDHLADFRLLLAELNGESPRGRVMVASAMLDDQLGKIIAARLVDSLETKKLLEGFNAPLGTFSARIIAAYGLGTISESELGDLQTIRKIRNLFAHRTNISFDDRQVIDWTANLNLAAKDYDDVIVNPMGRFTTAAVALIMRFTNRAHYVAQRRLSYESWAY